jgi:excisionase family DNA binding protein
MNNPLNSTVSIQFSGQIIIQRSDIERLIPQPEKASVTIQRENPSDLPVEKPGALPRLAFTVNETAEMLGVSYITVHRLLKRGLLRSSFATRRKIISRVEIERFLKETSRADH